MGLSKAPQENVNAFHFVWVGSHEPVLVCEVQLACVWRWETSRCSRASFINAAGDRRSVCRASHLALTKKHSCMLTGARFFTIPMCKSQMDAQTYTKTYTSSCLSLARPSRTPGTARWCSNLLHFCVLYLDAHPASIIKIQHGGLPPHRRLHKDCSPGTWPCTV